MHRIEQIDVQIFSQLVLYDHDPPPSQRVTKGQHELIASSIRRSEKLVPETDLESVASPD